MNRLFAYVAVLAVLFVSCNNQPVKETAIQEPSIDYSDSTYWFSFGDTLCEADVFYVYPTVSTISYADNDSSWYADITLDSVRAEANDNQRFNEMLYDEYNFYAPYYRQMIFEVYSQAEEVVDECAEFSANDVEDAFQYYMEHANGGRPFFLVGHSQGSQMLIELLKDGMTDEQRELMVAAYCIGYKVTADELAQYPEELQPANDSCDLGCLVVFNSITDTSAIALVSEGDVVGINPLTWDDSPDTVPATLHLGMAKYNETRDSILIVPCQTEVYLYKHNVVCTDIQPDLVFIPAYEEMFPKGNLHFADSWLFAGNVKENMQCRLRSYLNQIE